MFRFYIVHWRPVRHSFFRSARPLVFAHRGGSALAPENTLAAFDNGLALGADGLELDVHLSRDGVVVVHHDRTLERTTNLAGLLADRSAAELARADAGCRFVRDQTSPFAGQGIGVPTLDDVLARYPDRPIVVEMKVNTAELAAARVETVRQAECGGPCVPRCVWRARARCRARGRAAQSRPVPRGRKFAGRSIGRGAAGRCRAPPTPAIRCRSVRAGRAWCRPSSSTTRIAPDSACRSGRSIRKRTPRVSSAGAWTRSSRTDRTLSCR